MCNMYFKTSYLSPLGKIILLGCNDGLVGLWFENQKYIEKLSSFQNVVETNHFDLLEQTKKWLDDYFLGLNPSPKVLKIKLVGTSFQQAVWNILKEIPYGTVITYKEVATKLAQMRQTSKKAYQAVGSAIGHNPISIIIPCHRVVGSNGSLTGYAGGIDRKQKLLELEKVDIINLKNE